MNSNQKYIDLNASLNIVDSEGNYNLDKDKEAVKDFFINNINLNTIFFHDLEEKIEYLVNNNYYDKAVLDKYSWKDIKSIFKYAYNYQFRFKTYAAAFLFYDKYALKNRDKTRYLERYEDRVVMYALTIANGDVAFAKESIDATIKNIFQPATPTFQNAGLKYSGNMVSCFLINAQDTMESIVYLQKASLQLSKMGGGVGICLTNLREKRAPIRIYDGAAGGLVPVMKTLESNFVYANQLGQREGSGVVYLSIHHPDIIEVLDSKKENADELIRIKKLSLGIMVSDISLKLASSNGEMYLFSPHSIMKEYGVHMTDISITERYDELVANENIKKYKVNAADIFTRIAQVATESGYPYLIYEDVVNKEHNLEGRISQSNLCVEIMQVQTPSTFHENGNLDEVGRDISCNLGSLNVANLMRNGKDFGRIITNAVRALSSVSDQSNINQVETVKRGNELSHSIGLGHMNLHGFFGLEHMHYGSEESLEFTDFYGYVTAYHGYKASMELAKERNETFFEFEKSKYKTGEAFDKYTKTDEYNKPSLKKVEDIFKKYKVHIPTREEWIKLAEDIKVHGLYNAYIFAVAPTGSISYINFATPSITPITNRIEGRTEGNRGIFYVPAAEMTNENKEYFVDAYTLGAKSVIDVFSKLQKHVDQSMSMTLYFKSGATTRELVSTWAYARKKKIKSIYYTRIKRSQLEGVIQDECVSCVV